MPEAPPLHYPIALVVGTDAYDLGEVSGSTVAELSDSLADLLRDASGYLRHPDHEDAVAARVRARLLAEREAVPAGAVADVLSGEAFADRERAAALDALREQAAAFGPASTLAGGH